MDWLKADKPLDIALETDSTVNLFREIAQKSYRHQRRVMGLDREQARKLVTERQVEIYSRLTDIAVARVGRLLPLVLGKLRNVD